MKLSFLLIALIFLKVQSTQAEVIQFPEEQLSRESVVPVFDQPEAVKKRFVPTEDRWELAGFGGATLSDPFNNSIPLGGAIGYHFNEVHSLNINGAYFLSSQTGYVSQIQQVGSGGNILFAQAPHLTYMMGGEYEFTPFYGKISLTKQTVMNLSISGTIGGGVINVSTSSGFVASVGLNQRFFFTRNFGLKIDFDALFYQQNDVVSLTPAQMNVTNFLMKVGFVYLLPSL